MMFVGRITKDAVVSKLQDERQVVNFTVALNDYYKPKNSEQGVKTTTYVNCSYWISTAISERLTTGALVEIGGRPYVTAYMGLDNEAKASLNCHVNSIKIHQAAKDKSIKVETMQKEEAPDLPF